MKRGPKPKNTISIGSINIQFEYFWDYLRGYFDGDGSFYSYWDKRWKSSHMFYISFSCGSREHVVWLQERLENLLGIQGHVTKVKNRENYQLRYAKQESLEIILKMYYTPDVVCLARKKDKILKALHLEKVQQAKY